MNKSGWRAFRKALIARLESKGRYKTTSGSEFFRAILYPEGEYRVAVVSIPRFFKALIRGSDASNSPADELWITASEPGFDERHFAASGIRFFRPLAPSRTFTLKKRAISKPALIIGTAKRLYRIRYTYDPHGQFMMNDKV